MIDFFRKHSLSFLLNILSFSVGVFITFFFVKKLKIADQINLEVDLLGLLALLVTVLLTLYVTSQLSKKVQDARSFKDVSIRRMEKLEKLLIDKLRCIYEKPELDFVKKTTNNFRQLVRTDFDIYVRYGLLKKDDFDFIELIALIDKLWELLTSVEIGDDKKVTFDKATNTLKYSNQVQEDLIESHNKIRLLVFRIQATINQQ